ncbi:MAG TPA: hypothetical protein VGD83_03305 [Streptosporangiaceae bacterium]|jgi:hypothetical protein
MTPPRSPATEGADQAVIRADEADLDNLSLVMVEAFFGLPPAQ